MTRFRLERPAAWRFALVGALVSVPVGLLADRFPNTTVTVGGGVMVVGAFVAGVLAAVRSDEPTAAGFRTGLLGVFATLLPFLVTTAPTIAWSPSMAAFFAVGSVFLTLFAVAFGGFFGACGGRLADAVGSRYGRRHAPPGS